MIAARASAERGLSQNGLPIMTAERYAASWAPAYANGNAPSVSPAGIISGPGGPRDDAILARVSNREAIIRASSVERYGVGFIRSINEGTAPRELARKGDKDTRARGARRFADGFVPASAGPPREAFTMPSREAFAPAAPAYAPVTNVTVNTQGSSGDPAKDRANAEATAKAVEGVVNRVVGQRLNEAMRTNGTLWKAGVRRAQG